MGGNKFSAGNGYTFCSAIINTVRPQYLLVSPQADGSTTYTVGSLMGHNQPNRLD
jgi:hypothetical protein